MMDVLVTRKFWHIRQYNQSALLGIPITIASGLQAD
jgi:hypothetical protein